MSSTVAEVILENPPLLSSTDTGAETEGQAYKLSVPSLATEPIKVTAPDGSYFSWKPQMLLYKDEFNIEDYIIESMPSQLTVLGRQARYLRTFANADDVFHAEKDKVKHWTILNEPPRLYAEYLTGAIKFGVSGLINGTPLSPGIHESISQGMFSLPKPVIKDLIGNEIEGYYEVVDSDQGQILYLWFDTQYLNEAVYPVMIDPTVVISSAYTTSATARPQILSNGWIIVGVQNGTASVIFYVSKDNGSTWSTLTTWTINSNAGFSMCSYGTMIYAIAVNSTGTTVPTVKFDATTVGSTITSNNNAITNQTSFGIGCSVATNSNGTAFTVGVCSKNSTYPNSKNIISVKSNDFITWTKQDGTAGIDQITNYNQTNLDETNPYVVYKSNNLPTLVWQEIDNYNLTHNRAIYGSNYNGSSWGALYNIYSVNDNGDYTQYLPTTLIKKYGANIGRVWCAWHGMDTADTTHNNIRVSYNDDNGTANTWSTMKKITTGNTVNRQNVTLAERPNGDIICMYEDNGTIVYQVCPNGSTTFGGLTTIGAGTNPSMSDLIGSIISYIWKTSTNVQADKFTYNSPPLASTGLTRSNFDATQSASFTWTFNDPDAGNTQSAFQLVIYRVSDNAIIKDTGKVASTASSYNLPANTLTNGVQYQWKVNTWDNSDVQGVYSSLGTFTTAVAPIVSITFPANNGNTVSTSSLTAQWSFSDPGNNGQSAYQVRLTDNSDVVLFDSGKVTDANARSLTIPYTLVNGSYYKVKVTVWNGLGIQSTETVRTFYVSFTPPATPILSSTVDNIRGAITLNINNPVPSGSQPTVNYNDVYRGVAVLGKNLANCVYGGISESTGLDTSQNTYAMKSDFISAKPLTNYVLSGVPANLEDYFIFYYDSNKKYLSQKVDPFTTFTTPSNCAYIRFYTYNVDYPYIPNELMAIQIELGTVATSHENYGGNNISFIRIATGIANNGTFTDYTPASGQNYQYKVTAVGSNGTNSDSNAITSSILVLYTQLALTTDYSKFATLMYYEPRQINKQKQKASMQFAGREYQVSEFGEHSAAGVGLIFKINNINDLTMLRNLVDSEQILLYRDNRGRRMFVTIDTLGETDENPNFYTVSINPEQVSYCEVV